MPKQTHNAWLALPREDQFRAVLAFQHVAYEGTEEERRALFDDRVEFEQISAARTSVLSLTTLFASNPGHPSLSPRRLKQAVSLFHRLARSLTRALDKHAGEMHDAPWLWLPEGTRNVLAVILEARLKLLTGDDLFQVCGTSDETIVSHVCSRSALELRVYFDCGFLRFRDGCLSALIEAATDQTPSTRYLH